MSAQSVPSRLHSGVFKNKSKLRDLLINSAWFNLGWFACVVLGNRAVLAVLVGTVLIHYLLIRFDSKKWWFVVLLVGLGACFDTLLALTGVLKFPGALPFPPFWMLTLWMLFGTLILVSLPTLLQHKYLFLFLSALGGMLSYTAGVSLGAAEFGYPPSVAMPLLAISWLLAGIIIRHFYTRYI